MSGAEISDAQIWALICGLGLATFLIRFSFLGLVTRDLPLLALRMLRYAPVAVLPAVVAPQVVWPEAALEGTETIRIAVALVTLGLGVWFRSFLIAFGAGVALYYLSILAQGGPGA